MIVDAHVHLLPERLAAAIRRFFDARLPEYTRYPYERGAARAALVAAGVERCWSLPYAHRPGMASDLNRWMAETWADDPVVVPGGTLHVGDDVDAVAAEALDRLGLRLLKLHCSVGAFHADDPRLDPLWRRVSAGGQPVVIHAGQETDGRTTAVEVEEIARVAERWPDARLVLAHCAAPAIDAGLAVLRRTRAVHADLTPVGPILAAVRAETIAGVEDRLLFGSDAPNTGVTIEEAVAHVRALGLEASVESAILGGTACRLVGDA